MKRRRFVQQAVGGLGWTALAPAFAQQERDKTQHSKAGRLAGWSLRPGDPHKVATGAPRHRAFPGMERLRNGDILVAYREGSDHWRTPDGAVRLVRSRDNGATWTEPRTVVASQGINYGTHVGMAQLSDGSILLPYQSLAPGWEKNTAPRRIQSFLLRSTDNGDKWTPVATPGVDGLGSDYWWNFFGKILELSDSHTLLWPIARQKKQETEWRTGVLVSHDKGETWTEYHDVAVGLADEKYLISLGRGRLLALVRDLKKPYKLHQTESSDGGRTWLPYWEAGFPGHCPCLFRTSEGVLLCTHRSLEEGAPSGVGLHYSFDDGKSWHRGEDVYVSPDPANHDCSYPSMVQLNDKQILCVYYTTFRNGNSDIEAVVLNEA